MPVFIIVGTMVRSHKSYSRCDQLPVGVTKMLSANLYLRYLRTPMAFSSKEAGFESNCDFQSGRKSMRTKGDG